MCYPCSCIFISGTTLGHIGVLLKSRGGGNPMPTLSSIIRAFDIRNVGTCPTCMRISFAVMLSSWVLLACALFFTSAASIVVAVLSTALTVLWIAHIVARSAQSIRTWVIPENQSRRLAIRKAVMAVLGAAAMSAMSSKAYADSGCGGWAGNSGCAPLTGPWARCYRQRTDCSYYACRSCGNDCGDTVC